VPWNILGRERRTPQFRQSFLRTACVRHLELTVARDWCGPRLELFSHQIERAEIDSQPQGGEFLNALIREESVRRTWVIRCATWPMRRRLFT